MILRLERKKNSGKGCTPWQNRQNRVMDDTNKIVVFSKTNIDSNEYTVEQISAT